MRGLKHPEELKRTTIKLPVSVERRVHELQLLMRISRSEVIVYLIDREYDRRVTEIAQNRARRADKFNVDE
jgi:hypothetical protein